MRTILPLIVVISALGMPAYAAPAEPRLNGRVLNSQGVPLSNVFIQQQGGIASAISDERGNFVLKLDPTGQMVLVYSAVGYLNAEVSVGQAGSVILQPIPSYRPTFVLVQSAAAPVESRLFDTSLSLSYGVRNQLTTFNQRNNVDGWANNEIQGDARYRVGDVALGLKGFRNKVPVTVTGLATQPTSVPTVETSQVNLSLGYAFQAFAHEFLPQLVYSNYFVAPSNAGTPWTGTPLDYTQTRQGLGLALDVGHSIGAFDFIGNAAWLPYSISLTGAPYAVDNVGWNELGLLIGYNASPGLRIDLSYRRQFSSGTNYGDWANVYGLGLSYHPERNTP